MSKQEHSAETRGSGSPPGHDEESQPLDACFAPRAVAVIGASDKPGSVGRRILWNLISSPFGGTVYAVNPNRHNVLGIRAYPSVASVPEPVDLAMVLTPAATVPGIIDECITAGVKGAIIISAGFRETGEAGRALENQIRRQVQPGEISIIGPNSLGLMNPVTGLNAAFANRIAKKGTVGFISQSGAVCAAILDWSFQVNVGFSAFVSFGSMVDVGWADLIYYLGNDPNTKSIVLYIQSIGDARSFLSAVREVALTKPIIVLKAGQTEVAANAAKSSAYYAISDECDDAVLSAALRRSGVLRVDDVETLFAMAEVLAKQPRPAGRRLTILSNAAGPGILATDALVKDGGELAELSEETLAELNDLLPSYWNHRNPVDIVADADPERYARAVQITTKDTNSDGLLIVLTPQVMTDPTKTAEAITAIESFGGKPVLASWMGGDDVAAGEDVLNECNIPVFPYPDTAARIFNAMWRYSYNLRALYETPVFHPHDEDAAKHERGARIIESALAAGQAVLPGPAANQILEAYGLPAATGREPPKDAYEIVLGSSIDPQFGPYLFFGPGGQMGRALRERALGLPPLNSTLARRMMEQTRLYNALEDEARATGLDLSVLERLLVRFAHLIVEQRRIRKVEISLSFAAPDRLDVTAAQVSVHDADTKPEALPKLAIRPYPSEYVTQWTMKNGQEVTLRPIRPEDEPLMVEFHQTLSKDTVYYRFLRLLAYDQRIKHERLTRLCFLDYDRAMAIIAVHRDPQTGERRILGTTRMVRLHGTSDADFAILVGDDIQGQGLGTALLDRLAEVARAENVRRLVGTVLPDNAPMLRLCAKLGFERKTVGEEVIVEKVL